MELYFEPRLTGKLSAILILLVTVENEPVEEYRIPIAAETLDLPISVSGKFAIFRPKKCTRVRPKTYFISFENFL